MNPEWPDARLITLGQRIRLARRRGQLTQDELGERVGVTRNSVSQWESDATVPETQRLALLVDVLQCPSGWLVSGDGPPERGHAPNAQFIEEPGADYQRKVPLVSRVPGGPAADAADPYAKGAAEDWLLPHNPISRRGFALRVTGDSMEPEFRDGTVIFVDPARPWKSGDFVVARFDESSEATFKKIVVDGDKVLLVPLNPRYLTREVTDATVICGVVTEQRRIY